MTEVGTKETTRTSPLAMFDLTIPGNQYTLNLIKDFMRSYCKRWCFQEEQGCETGYKHYQCRISLQSKKRLSNMITFINEKLPGAHVSATSNPTYYSGNEFYVMKEDTRINGPWNDRDDLNINELPDKYKEDHPEWRPWQQTVLSMLENTPDDREVNVILDRKGNIGKTFLTMWLACRKRADKIPLQKDARDIMRMVMCKPIKKAYFIDLPRADNIRDMRSMYAAIEEIKNGYAYDDRYKFTDKYFNSPHVFVFANDINDMMMTDLLSRDRWRIFKVMDNHLVPAGDDIRNLSIEPIGPRIPPIPYNF